MKGWSIGDKTTYIEKQWKPSEVTIGFFFSPCGQKNENIPIQTKSREKNEEL